MRLQRKRNLKARRESDSSSSEDDSRSSVSSEQAPAEARPRKSARADAQQPEEKPAAGNAKTPLSKQAASSSEFASQADKILLPGARENGSSSHNAPTATIVVSRLPKHFIETPLQKFFSQFGTVKQLRLSRNKKSGHTKHYAFIEFEDVEVAKIVAETMHGYLMGMHVLQCRQLHSHEMHADLWNGANRRFRNRDKTGVHAKKVNRKRTPAEQQKRLASLIRLEGRKRARLAALGIDYDFPGYANKPTVGEQPETIAAPVPKKARRPAPEKPPTSAAAGDAGHATRPKAAQNPRSAASRPLLRKSALK